MAKFVGGCVVLFVLAVGFISLPRRKTWPHYSRPSAPSRCAETGLVPCRSDSVGASAVRAVARRRAHPSTQGRGRAGIAARRRAAGRAGSGKVPGRCRNAVHHLARTDPEDAIGAVRSGSPKPSARCRSSKAATRSAICNPASRRLRAQQQSLRERLTFRCSKSGARSSSFSASSTAARTISTARLPKSRLRHDATAIEVRLKSLMEFVRQEPRALRRYRERRRKRWRP